MSEGFWTGFIIGSFATFMVCWIHYNEKEDVEEMVNKVKDGVDESVGKTEKGSWWWNKQDEKDEKMNMWKLKTCYAYL